MGDIGVLPSGRPPAGPRAAGCRDQPLARTQPLQTRPRVRCSSFHVPRCRAQAGEAPKRRGGYLCCRRGEGTGRGHKVGRAGPQGVRPTAPGPAGVH